MKRIALILLFFISCTTSPKINYEGELNDDGLYHGKGVITYPNGSKYVGEFKDGKRDGQGTFNYPSGEKYVGEWKDGLLYGQGTFISPDGFSYEGDFKGKNINDIIHFLITSSGTRYDGVITRGTRKGGFGIFTVKSHISPDSVDRFGNRYEGEFVENKFNGQGTFTFPDGKKYIGGWKDGKYDGQGTLTLSDGTKYVGEYKDGLTNGQGTLTLSGGSKYVGEFKDGKFNGQGTYTYSSGETWTGEWVDNERHTGEGTFKERRDEKTAEQILLKNITEKLESLEQRQSGDGLVNWKEELDNYKAQEEARREQDKMYFQQQLTNLESQQKLNLINNPPPPPETLTNIAVVNFKGNNISDGDVNALTDRLRIELFKTKYFKVIEREMMEEVLKEQGFQQSGCTTDECMVQIGRLIGVQKIIGGSISKVGNIYSVSSRIVNVETGEIEKTEVYDHTGNIGQLLTEGMRMIAIGLVQ